MSGIDPKHMSHIETGRSFPKSDLIEKLADALNVHYTELFKTKHLADRKTILNEMEKILKNSNNEDLSMIYKFTLNYFN